MKGTLRFSEAFTLGLHAAWYLAGHENGMASTREIADYLGVSEAHLAKVMQRLARAGILESSRGPGGGFRLSREGSKISLMDIYESLEGPFSPTACLLDRDSCLGRSCILAGLLRTVDDHFETYLRETHLGSAGAMLATRGKGDKTKAKGSPRSRGNPHAQNGLGSGKAFPREGSARAGKGKRGGKARPSDAEAGPGGPARKGRE